MDFWAGPSIPRAGPGVPKSRADPEAPPRSPGPWVGPGFQRHLELHGNHVARKRTSRASQLAKDHTQRRSFWPKQATPNDIPSNKKWVEQARLDPSDGPLQPLNPGSGPEVLGQEAGFVWKVKRLGTGAFGSGDLRNFGPLTCEPVLNKFR